MKKSLMSLLVLACVAPAMAVTVTLSQNPAGTLVVDYALDAGETNIRGLALVFETTSGDAALSSVDAGAFNTFIDYAIDAVGYELGDGHPVANPDAAGTIDPATTPTKFAVSMGYLDEAGAQAGLGNGSFSIAYTGSGEVTVTLDALRGGIVGDDVAGATIVGGDVAPATISIGTGDCFNSTDPAKNTLWATYGKPESWCWLYNCRGDLNKAMSLNKPVTSTDLTIFASVYNIKYVDLPAEKKADGAAADLDRKQSLGKGTTSNDLTIFAGWYNQKTVAAGGTVPECGAAEGVMVVK